jgi:cyclase
MTLRTRLIVCLDVRDGRVVKGARFVDLREVGDPVALAERYEREGADELVFLDIVATHDERATMLELARRTAERLFIPLTIGGGIRSTADISAALRAGADKVGINTAAVRDPSILSEGARRYGAQCIVVSIDAKREDDRWTVFTAGGRQRTELDAVAWARECVERGVGEILLTSIDQDGARSGYDLELTRAIASVVDVPVIASGGAGTSAHVVSAIRDGGADAALVAGILHDGVTTVAEIKSAMHGAGLLVRAVAA